jgi:hypothetical protein
MLLRNQRIVSIFIKAHHWPYRVSWIQSTPLHSTSLKYFLILSFYLRPCFPAGLFAFSDITFECISHLSHVCSLLPWFHQLNNIWRIVPIMNLLIMQSFFLLLLLPLSSFSLYSSTPCFQTPSFSVLPLEWDTKFRTYIKQQIKLYHNQFATHTLWVFSSSV